MGTMQSLLEIVAGLLSEVLSNAEKDANQNFRSIPVGDPIEHCPQEQKGQRIIGQAQAKRANDKFDKMSDTDKKKFQDILRNTKSDEEKLYIWKAFGACHSIDDCHTFADKIRGKDPKWLNDHCRLTGGSNGIGIQQQWSHSCNATTAQAVRGEMDPIYALKEHEDNPNWGKIDDNNAMKENPNLASEQKKMLESEYIGPAAPPHKGVAADRANPGAGAGRWASDLLNDPGEQTGVTYITRKDPNSADASKAIDSGIAQAVPVPIVIGNGAGQYTHYVLITGADSGPPKIYTIHDPWSGTTVNRTEDDVKNGKIDIAGSNMITAVEDPQLQSSSPAVKATC